MNYSWVAALSVIAGVASIAGLVLSVHALLRAQSAKQAAIEAREAVRQANAAENLRDLVATAKDLITCVENRQIDAARVRATELVAAVSQAKERWPLPGGSRERLDRTAQSLTEVSRRIGKRGSTLEAEERDRLLEFAHEVLRTLAEEAGKVLSMIERRKQ